MRITLNAQILHNFITRSAHNLCLGFHGILGSDGTVKGIARAASESGESAPRQMTNIVSRIGDSVGLAAGCTLLGGADVYLIVLELADVLEDACNDPGAVTDTGRLEAQSKDEKEVCERAVQEDMGKGRGGILPRDGGNDRGDDGAVETEVQELLGTVRDSEDVVALTRRDVQSRNRSDQEETSDDGELTSNHESGEVTPVAVE